MAQSAALKEYQSFWIASTRQSSYPPIAEDLSVDVAIVGAGLAGITTAMLLKQAGKTVAVLEADRVAEGVSGRTTAKLTSLHQLKYATSWTPWAVTRRSPTEPLAVVDLIGL